MAVTINAKGTTVPYFKIGKGGTTLYQGSTDPTGTYTVNDNDVWLDTNTGALKFYNSGGPSWDLTQGSLGSTVLNDVSDVNTSGATNGQVLTYNSGNSTWEPTTVSGGSSFQRAAVTSATYTMSSGDTFVGVNYAGTVTITMFNSQTAGTEIIIKDESGAAGTYNITINTTNSETIDGASSFVIDVDSAALRLLWTGVEWSIV